MFIYLHNTCGFYLEDIFTPYTHVRLVLSVVKCTKRIVSGENQTERNVIATGARVQRIVFYRLRLSAVTHSCVRATYPQAPVMITVHHSQPTPCSQLTTPAHVGR